MPPLLRLLEASEWEMTGHLSRSLCWCAGIAVSTAPHPFVGAIAAGCHRRSYWKDAHQLARSSV